MTFAEKMFSFQGRMRRQDFWICTLIIWGVIIASIILMFVIAWTPLMALAENPEMFDNPEDPTATLQAMAPILPAVGIAFLVQMATIWPSLAVCVKRFHDRGQSGWWVMLLVAAQILSIIPIIGGFFYLAGIIFWLVNLGILEGTPGPNQYGPSPKGLGNAEVFA